MRTIKYAIKNHKDLYIRLSENGKAATCSKAERDLFEYSKAKNIVNHLPKTLKRLNFRVEAVSDIKSKSENKRKLENTEYEVPENVTKWIEKFGTCADILNEAKNREKDLIGDLTKSDKELLDILHIIEMEKPKDLYGGWLIYKRIRKNRKTRREYKDELLIVENVLKEINPSCLQREKIEKAIKGLFGRKYSFRIVEEEGEFK